jgi:hypothetical protein
MCSSGVDFVNSRRPEGGLGSNSMGVQHAASTRRTLRQTPRNWRRPLAHCLPTVSDRPKQNCDTQDIVSRSPRNAYSTKDAAHRIAQHIAQPHKSNN